MKAGRWVVFSFAVAMLGMGLRAPSDQSASLLPLAPTGVAPAPKASAFVQDAVYSSTSKLGLPTNVAAFGSWLGGDAFQGSYQSAWYEAARKSLLVYVAGYPSKPGNKIEVVVRNVDGTTKKIRYDAPDPREAWVLWTVELPKHARYAQVRATDGNSESGGWVGVSQPVKPKVFGPRSASWAWLRLIGTTCLALCLLYGPGLIWLQKRKQDAQSYPLAALAGPLLLVAIGILCWTLGGLVPAAWIARTGVAISLCWLGYSGYRLRTLPILDAEGGAVVRCGALLVGFAVATANISYGPTGELYGGSISRTMAVGGHADSRISFHVVQVAANHLWPFEPNAASFFAPWSFASRGPLSGLLTTPIVLSAGAIVPLEMPDHPWRPFDAQGFVTYRIASIVLASLAAWAVFGVVAAASNAGFGLLAAITLQLSPFFVHELYFTWPKMIAATCVLTSFTLLRQSRPFLSGTTLALGYLFHPLAILSAPFLMLWATTGRASGLRRLKNPTLLLCGIITLALPWLAFAKLQPSRGGQDVFVRYLVLADGQIATLATWLHSRWDNFANTFIPFYMFNVDPKHESINSIFGPSDAYIHFGFLYWNTFPFALGLPAFAAVAPALLAALRRTPWIAFATVFGPALFLVLYWGAASTGLMRHCGQVLFVSSVALAGWTLAQPGGRWRSIAVAWLAAPASLLLRALDLLWSTFGNTLHNHWPQLSSFYGLNDWLSLVCAVIFLVWTCWLMVRSLQASRDQLQCVDQRHDMVAGMESIAARA